ncbi:FAD-dependent monooxygenase [Halalkalicoccus salilacus]|uniref:FAD-dependent monooxygenase n=1 Tax=Halalkalicoccus salilacus TaxID=3117459 RepID=UPI00300E8108
MDLETDVAVVGAGSGGCVLSYPLSFDRSGVETVLLERHATLDREFRGYPFRPLALAAFEGAGLLESVLEPEHERVRRPRVSIHGRPYATIDPVAVDASRFVDSKAQSTSEGSS